MKSRIEVMPHLFDILHGGCRAGGHASARYTAHGIGLTIRGMRLPIRWAQGAAMAALVAMV
jgi:hypothetical protein